MLYSHSKFLARSRTVFLDDNAQTLGDVLHAIENDEAINPSRRRDMCSALKRVSTEANSKLNEIPATPHALRMLFVGLSPIKCGVSSKTFRNLRSLVAAAVREYGNTHPFLAKRIPPTPEWDDHLNRIEVPSRRHALSRLGTYCSAMGIAPDDVTSNTLLGLCAALEAEEMIKDPRTLIKNTISGWNRCMREVPGWPQTRIGSPFRKEPTTLPLSAFPNSFRTDVETWRSRMSAPEIFDDNAPERALSPSTIEYRVRQFREFASALVSARALEIEEIVSLTVMFEPDSFKAGLRVFLERAGEDKTRRIHNLANALRHVGHHHCGIEGIQLDALEQICRKVRPDNPKAMSERVRVRLRQFDDPMNVARLLNFPDEEEKRARKIANPYRRAKSMERGLIVALLINCGLRQRTLRTLELEDFDMNVPKQVFLYVPGSKTKTNTPLEFELNETSCRLLRTFLDEWRGLLPGADGPYLFPGKDGGPRSKNAIYDSVCRSMSRDAGLDMNPHLFRHALAKIAVERNPGAYAAVSRFLGHKSLDTTMANYLGTESKAAGRHIDRLLEEARLDASKETQTRRNRSAKPKGSS